MNMKKSLNVRELTRAALIAAIYCVVTILWPFSFGSIQVRISEALTLLPVLFPAAIPGVSVGCMLAGLLTGAPWFDWLFGSLTTLTAALLTRKYHKPLWLAAVWPTLLNAVITGAVVHFSYVDNPTLSLLPLTMLSVGAGEAIACFGLGLPLLLLLRKTGLFGFMKKG